ncbi:MAG: MFS transporter [Candidatus Omnitrophica bacterium]|nr:MFS transporter [Candidatus Omnitrophota bacterium]
MASFREVLKNKNFFLLWLGQIISQFGDRLNQMALIALISARAPGSTWQLAKTLSCTVLPVLLVGPIASSYVDRWDRRRTMIVCDFLRAVLVGSIFLVFIKLESIWPVYLVIFLTFSISRFFVPAKMAIIPELVSAEKLLLANSLTSITGMIAVVAGFGLGGLLVERIGSAGGFLIDALTYLVSALLILAIIAKRIPDLQPGHRVSRQVLNVRKILKKTLFTDIKEGWQYFLGDKDVRFVAQLFFFLGATIGAISVVTIVFVQNAFGSVTYDLGILAVFLGVGLFCGALIYGRFGDRFSRMKTITVALGSSGLVLIAFTIFLKVFSSSLFAQLLSLILGLTLAPIIISSQTLIHEVTQEKMRGRTFGSLDIVGYSAFLLFMFLSSFLAEQIGRFWILIFVGLILSITGWGTFILGEKNERI